MWEYILRSTAVYTVKSRVVVGSTPATFSVRSGCEMRPALTNTTLVMTHDPLPSDLVIRYSPNRLRHSSQLGDLGLMVCGEGVVRYEMFYSDH